ncbi:MAG: tetratricopeptide repeat protein [Qingshengfaniella sp.]
MAVWLSAAPLLGQADGLETLLDQLRAPALQNWEEVENRIWAEWAQSGSPAMDLLLVRGRQALAEGNTRLAIAHLTALTDHAPEFAEGYNARATAYFRAGLYGPSLRDIEATLALNPQHFGALAGLGLILEELNQPQEALSAYRAAHAIHPHMPHVREAITRLEGDLAGSEI